MPSMRLRQLGITSGRFPTGPINAITDVQGVTAGHCTLIYDQSRVVRTGITMILPRGEDTWITSLRDTTHKIAMARRPARTGLMKLACCTHPAA